MSVSAVRDHARTTVCDPALKKWLATQLADREWRELRDIRTAMREAFPGIHLRFLSCAAAQLGVQAWRGKQSDGASHYSWRIPPFEDAHPPREWEERAKCRDLPPEWFETENLWHTNADSAHAQAAAREACHGCPVMAQCATAAIRLGDSGVIRAGVAIADDYPTRRTRAALQFAAANNRNHITAAELTAYIATHDIQAFRRSAA